MVKKLSRIYPLASLELSNGIVMQGKLRGAQVQASGEMVFTTGMVGYSEALTNPSYSGQILLFSFALIGNYGVPALKNEGLFVGQGHEGDGIKAAGVILSDTFHDCFHYKGGVSFDEWLCAQGVPAISGIDTRALVKILRKEGKILARIRPFGEKNKIPFIDSEEKNYLKDVSVKLPEIWGNSEKKVTVLDLGSSLSLVRGLFERGPTVEILPFNSVPNMNETDALVISGGPGDPRKYKDIVETIKTLLPCKKPLLAIGLGHELLAMALGAKIINLRPGHHGDNCPIYNPKTGKGFMSGQNHFYAVKNKTLPKDFEEVFLNANDGTVEGFMSKDKMILGVQFNPEFSTDTAFIIDEFVERIKSEK